MAERVIDQYLVRSGASAEGARFTAWLAVSPASGKGFPVYYAICENRSFRERGKAEQAAADALADMQGLEEDGTPVFPEGYTGFADEPPADPA
jgi:hypothetical protein